MPETHYDVAIVGAGFSGPILASKIAEKGVNPRNGDRLKVALIDAGPYLKGDPKPGYGHPVRRHRFANMGRDPGYHFRDFPGQFPGELATGAASAKLVGGSSMHPGASTFLDFPMDYMHYQNETGVD